MTERSLAGWKAIARSVRGVAHERAELPNQDAFRLFPEDGGPCLIAAVSDGHGSRECFRSDVGAEIAVRVAIEALTPLLEPQQVRLPTLKHLVEQQLARDIVTRWKSEVDKDIDADPLPARQEQRGQNTTEEANHYIPYGATLLGVLVTGSHLVCVQLGDGDIVTVSANGEVGRAIPKDERLIANFTTSLCMPEATREMRVKFQPLSNDAPALIMLSTDGYSNSFVDEQSFLKVGTDVLAAVKDSGLDSVRHQLGDWLSEASRLGSGDDTTVAILCRTELDGATPAAADQTSGALPKGPGG